jgi:alkylation response protein AidB-like acyl-CoA dehydrogenase
MDLHDSPEDAAFRAEARGWLEANLSGDFANARGLGRAGRQHEGRDLRMAWERKLGLDAWTCVGWPVEYGGRGAPMSQQVIWNEEYVRADAPARINVMGEGLLGPTLIAYGTDEQKQRFLNPIRWGLELWCQGYSEPNAGSDLASLATRAEDRGDHFLVNGQKIWTSYADKADWIFCLVRTDPAASKHLGISFILFDMRTSGVSTKPILLISGKSPFCETFFDNVRVPKGQVVGELNKGWEVAKYLLTHEREMISAIGLGAGRPLGQVAADALGSEHGMLAETCLRADIARFEVDSAAFQFALERTGDLLKAKQASPAISSMLKYYGAELNKRRHELLMTAGGSDALEWESERSRGGDAARGWLRTKANSIEGGTSEVQLNVIAKRILELPGA